MFYHTKKLQYFTPPEQPDPVYAMKMQELIGGVFGEMTVMMQYLFQGWNCRGPAKYRDMLLDTGTEEIGHIEILATTIAHLLDKAPLKTQEASAQGRWARGRSMDGKGEFQYVENPRPLGPEPQLAPPEPQLHGTPSDRQTQGNGASAPTLVEHI
ncbi:manganese containing catalase [Cylindrospermum sp. NIES-4074]|nr:manganese containing catalase [Cylindrospermum sp. NIES-4074]